MVEHIDDPGVKPRLVSAVLRIVGSEVVERRLDEPLLFLAEDGRDGVARPPADLVARLLISQFAVSNRPRSSFEGVDDIGHSVHQGAV